MIKLGYSALSIESGDTASQILYAGLRFSVAGILAILFGSIAARKFLIPRVKSLIPILKLCSMQTVLQYTFFYMGLARTSAVNSSIINGTQTFLTIIMACLVFREEKLTSKKFIGCILGFVGIVIVNFGNLDNSGVHLLGDSFIFISGIAAATSSVLIHRFSKDENPVILSGYQFLIGGLILIAVGFVFGGSIVFNQNGALVLFYLSFVSAAAYTFWSILLKYNEISRIAVYKVAIPIFGVIISAILLGEGEQALKVQNLIALLFVCAGILVVQVRKNVKE
jgi:drug/metabolite transporter (DMT)-like permease